MLQLDKAEIAARLPWPALVEALRAMFVAGCQAPLRHRHPLPADGTLLLMPAVNETHSGVKIVHVAPGNTARGEASVNAAYLLSDAVTGVPIALLDGGELTDRRTAAASLLAARYLARPDSKRLLVLGAGKVAAALADAYAAGFPIEEIAIWSRDPAKSGALAARLAARGLPARAAPTPNPAGFDIVSAATLSREPLIRGATLSPGTHLDLVGAFRADMRETDGETLTRSLCVVDTRIGGLAEAGDVVQAIAEGHIAATDIAAELSELCKGLHPGRTSAEQITLFKSVGWAGEDLAAAILATRG
ncbi:bifunctional Delta(1)-pyrroline-2-carboxylate/Delta(1)-piperideine-2-carboxylate reductase [Roseococcus pinisoli]|uniref:Ornithine cyclodeaminase family protein n=1 Tax=Roseococcus pinisoli TaxID=2835040 RepID=A0ABS5QAR3_9PROT|nr:ornithine cyclodeaminase family protein [Roseococcus pinisoli]MBS7810326.1 ornithine cyclodeaminase family protein [Roseococcus pinisoli]